MDLDSLLSGVSIFSANIPHKIDWISFSSEFIVFLKQNSISAKSAFTNKESWNFHWRFLYSTNYITTNWHWNPPFLTTFIDIFWLRYITFCGEIIIAIFVPAVEPGCTPKPPDNYLCIQFPSTMETSRFEAGRVMSNLVHSPQGLSKFECPEGAVWWGAI